MENVLNENVINDLAAKLNIKVDSINAVLSMLAEDKTVAFIARYRKEATGGLDEEAIRMISDEYEYSLSLLKRKEDVIRLIEEKGLMNDELKEKIMAASKLIEVEDLYRPYKEKKKTKATEAIALGLDGLADIMMRNYQKGDRDFFINPFLNDKVPTKEKALELAKYIIAERISDEASYREYIRDKALIYGTISCKKKNNDNDPEEKYKNYYESSENIARIKPHRLLAINRAENEDVISVKLELQPERDIDYLKYRVTHNRESLFKPELIEAIEDSYKRLIAPSIAREIRAIKNEEAEAQAIKIFAMNLKNLLMQPPIKGKVVQVLTLHLEQDVSLQLYHHHQMYLKLV